MMAFDGSILVNALIFWHSIIILYGRKKNSMYHCAWEVQRHYQCYNLYMDRSECTLTYNAGFADRNECIIS